MPEFVQYPVWQALATTHAPFAERNGLAVRYQRGVIPFAAVSEFTTEAFACLRDLLAPEEGIYLPTPAGAIFPTLSGLRYDSNLVGYQMAYAGQTPEPDEASTQPPILQLTEADIPEILALKAIAFPGYFGERAATLGDFFGIRQPDTNELIAMSGERFCFTSAREISAVCTHPDHLGQGHAARLMRASLRAQAKRGTPSILHVVAANTRAVRLYHHLGFVTTGDYHFHHFTRTDAA